jgi:hypothetical protein
MGVEATPNQPPLQMHNVPAQQAGASTKKVGSGIINITQGIENVPLGPNKKAEPIIPALILMEP